jgi:hypothetical protein
MYPSTPPSCCPQRQRLQPLQRRRSHGQVPAVAGARARPALAQDRTLALSVVAVAKASTALDDTLDLMSKEVETALANGLTLSGKNLPVLYAGMQFEDEASDKPVGIKRMRFTISFTAMSNAPDVLI